MRIVSPYTYPHNWLKGNFHTHTTHSDGDTSSADVVAMYRDDNYDFLAITDHDRLSLGDEPGAGKMLLLPGQECHIPGDSPEPQWHVVGLGLTRQIERQPNGQALIDSVASAGGLPIVCHPRWSWMPYEAFDALSGYAAFEVYNGVCEIAVERGFSVDYWDHYMTKFRRPVWAVATDDLHWMHSGFALGWTVVNAERTPESIYAALRRGDMYSTCGPRIETIRSDDFSIEVHTSAAKAVKFRKADGGNAAVIEGAHVKSAVYHPRGDEVYVRVEVHGHDGRIAWSNPFMIEP